MKLPGTHKHARIAVGLYNTDAYRDGFDRIFKEGNKSDSCAAVSFDREGRMQRCLLSRGHAHDHKWSGE